MGNPGKIVVCINNLLIGRFLQLSLLVTLFNFQQALGQTSWNGSDIHSRMHNASTVIIVSPHPDDEVLGFAGIIYDAIRMGKTVKVVLLTNGEGYGSACYFWKNGCPAEDSTCRGAGCTTLDLEQFGKIRIEESKRALKHLGLDPENLILLGYPDGFIGDMLHYPDSIFTSVTGNNVSVTGKKFTGQNLIDDLKTLFKAYKSEIVFTTHIMDQHSDHSALASFIQQARKELASENILFPTYWGVIHQPGWGDSNSWPPPSYSGEFRKGEAMISREQRYCPGQPLYPPDAMKEPPEWYFIDPHLLKAGNGEKSIMRKAIDEYKTQSGQITISGSLPGKDYVGWLDRNGFLLSFVKMNHLFWEAPSPTKQ
jgi:LmbE family N-acetylglucosaminyl deacetylase